MNRRAFLRWLGGTAAGVAAAPYLDLDKLLWVPGEKTILLPTVEAVDRFVTVEWITRDMVQVFANSLRLTSMVDRSYEEQWGLA